VLKLDEKEALELLEQGRKIVHCSHEGAQEFCDWPFCKRVNAFLARVQGQSARQAELELPRMPSERALVAVREHPVRLPRDLYSSPEYELFIGFTYHLQQIVGPASEFMLPSKPIAALLGLKDHGVTPALRHRAIRDGFLKVINQEKHHRSSYTTYMFQGEAAIKLKVE
jgi:hypothetical protein